MDLRNQRTLLEAKQHDLEQHIARLSDDAKETRQAADVEDPIDSVTSSASEGAVLQTASQLSDSFAAVRSALDRIENGTYGVCIDCGERIEEARLSAVPWAAYCLKDQERHEEEKRQMGSDFLEAAV